MLQVIALACVAAAVFTAAVVALGAVHESTERATGTPSSTVYVPMSPGSREMAGQPARYQPIVNLNVVLPFSLSSHGQDARAVLNGTVAPRPIVTGNEQRPGPAYIDGTAREVSANGYGYPSRGPARALAEPEAEWRAQLDVTA